MAQDFFHQQYGKRPLLNVGFGVPIFYPDQILRRWLPATPLRWESRRNEGNGDVEADKCEENWWKLFGWWFQLCFIIITPHLRKIPILTIILQGGWNHQLLVLYLMDTCDGFYLFINMYSIFSYLYLNYVWGAAKILKRVENIIPLHVFYIYEGHFFNVHCRQSQYVFCFIAFYFHNMNISPTGK